MSEHCQSLFGSLIEICTKSTAVSDQIFGLLLLLASLMESFEPESRLLTTDQKDWQDRTLCSRCEGKISRDRFSKYKTLLIFELCQILVVLLSLTAWNLIQRYESHSDLNQCKFVSQKSNLLKL